MHRLAGGPRGPLVITLSVLLASLVALCGATAPASAQTAPADVWSSVYVGLYDLGPGMIPTLVITGVLDEDAEPPVEAALPVPKGAGLSWAGEILGGDPAADPVLSVEVEERDDYDLVHFELSRSTVAQLELSVPEGMVRRDEDGTSVDLMWTSAGALDSALVSVASPLEMHFEAQGVTPKVDVLPDSVLYSVETSPVASGDTVGLSGELLAGPDPVLTEPTPETEAPGETAAEPDDGAAGQDGETSPTADADVEVGELEPVDGDVPAGEEDEGFRSAGLIALVLGVVVIVGFLLVKAARGSQPTE